MVCPENYRNLVLEWEWYRLKKTFYDYINKPIQRHEKTAFIGLVFGGLPVSGGPGNGQGNCL
ncbi:hypothetical protein GCM10028791_17530 [Echinicola sediminis]